MVRKKHIAFVWKLIRVHVHNKSTWSRYTDATGAFSLSKNLLLYHILLLYLTLAHPSDIGISCWEFPFFCCEGSSWLNFSCFFPKENAANITICPSAHLSFLLLLGPSALPSCLYLQGGFDFLPLQTGNLEVQFIKAWRCQLLKEVLRTHLAEQTVTFTSLAWQNCVLDNVITTDPDFS